VNYEIPRITRCALCRYFVKSAHCDRWFCSLHYHIAEENGGCTWGEEVDG